MTISAALRFARGGGFSLLIDHAAASPPVVLDWPDSEPIDSPPLARDSMKAATLSVEKSRLPRFCPRSRSEEERIFPAEASSYSVDRLRPNMWEIVNAEAHSGRSIDMALADMAACLDTLALGKIILRRPSYACLGRPRPRLSSQPNPIRSIAFTWFSGEDTVRRLHASSS